MLIQDGGTLCRQGDDRIVVGVGIVECFVLWR
jgi:hypothetical protein